MKRSAFWRMSLFCATLLPLFSLQAGTTPTLGHFPLRFEENQGQADGVAYSGVDSDGDGITDEDERLIYKTDPFKSDSDGDDLDDGYEIYTSLTDPNNSDSDGDGMIDGAEVRLGLNPKEDDAFLDPDDDLVSNLMEYMNQTDPYNADTDNDSLGDGWEIQYGSNPVTDATAYRGVRSIKSVGSWNDTAFGSMSNVEVRGNRLFVNVPWRGQYIFDISTPASPSLLGTQMWDSLYNGDLFDVSEDGNSFVVFVGGFLGNAIDPNAPPGAYDNTLFFGLPIPIHGLKEISVIDPSNPVLLGDIRTSMNLNAISMDRDLVFAGNDIMHLPTGMIRATIDDLKGVGELQVVNGILYALAQTVFSFPDPATRPLEIYDVSEPSNSIHLSSYLPYGRSLGFYVEEDRLFLSLAAGFDYIDVSNPAYPTLLRTYSQNMQVHDVHDQYAFGLTGTNRVTLVDLEDVSSSEFVGDFTTSGSCCDLAIKPPYIYVADGYSGLRILKVSWVDEDRDRLPDEWEELWFGDLSQTATNDFDQDGIWNIGEYEIGTNPRLADTDADTYIDGDEIMWGTDPNDDSSQPELRLLGSSLSPVTGTRSESFSFSVTYINPQGTESPTATVFVADHPYELQLLSGQSDYGLYGVVLTLPEGEYDHYFNVLDHRGDRVRLPATGVCSGPVVLGNRLTLGNPVLTPGSGRGFTDTVWHFEMDYHDSEASTAAVHQVQVNDTLYEMTYAGQIGGMARYAFDITLPAGNHTHSYNFEDGDGDAVRSPPIGTHVGPLVQSNLIELRDAAFIPLSGSTSTLFRFTVNYYDTDGVPPATARIVINDVSIPLVMGSTEGDKTPCTYETTLSAGQHRYYFVFEDPSGKTVTWGEAGITVGPLVMDDPNLIRGFVDPLHGYPGSNYTFRTTFFDPEGESPQDLFLLFDGEYIAMDFESGLPDSGDYAMTLVLTNSGHTFHFEAVTATGEGLRYPLEGELKGPSVSDSPICYVNPTGLNIAPYNTPENAATTIRAAVDIAVDGDLILVSPGTYLEQTVSGLFTYGLLLDKAVYVKAMDGPAETRIQAVGVGLRRGVTITHAESVLEGFTVTGGIDCKGGLVDRCWIIGNEWQYGGGVSAELGARIRGCIIRDNIATVNGGGIKLSYGASAESCFIHGNEAIYYGGGVFMDHSSELINCTITGNRAGVAGGGAYGTTYLDDSSVAHNTIFYYNSSLEGADVAGFDMIDHSCLPLDLAENGNITNAPGILTLGNPHLLITSHCLDAGDGKYTTVGKDIDGDVRLYGEGVDMGCDEVNFASLAGPLQASLTCDHSSLVVGADAIIDFSIEGRAFWFSLDWGDSTVFTNSLQRKHVYSAPGDYQVILRVKNYDHQALAVIDLHVIEAFTCHVATNGSAVSPYGSWVTAATNIQDAIDEAVLVKGVSVLVSNGVYATGSRVVEERGFNRIVIPDGLQVHSVNGSEDTIISGTGPRGASAVRCAYIQEGSLLSGFTLTNGHTVSGWSVSSFGGGAYCERGGQITDCRVTGNHAYSGGGVFGGAAERCTFISNHADDDGGGAHSSQLLNSLLADNEAQGWAGGVCDSTAKNCTVVSNMAQGYGGGVFSGTLENCIVYDNQSVQYPDTANYYAGSMNNCCTWPSIYGTGNITNAPIFADASNEDYRLTASSPGIDAGRTNELVEDFDGTPRPLDGQGDGLALPDMGAYEFFLASADSDGDSISDGWEMDHGFNPVDATDASGNLDNDPYDNREEFVADTDPNDSNDWFRIIGTDRLPEWTVYFDSSSNRFYTLLWCTNLVDGVWTNVPGTPPRMGAGGADSMTATNNLSAEFYKLTVELP